MALKLAGKDINVILTYQSKKEETKQVVEELEQTGQKAAAPQLNIGDIKSFDEFFKKLTDILKEKFNTSRIDFLIFPNDDSGKLWSIGLAELKRKLDYPLKYELTKR